MTYLDLKTRVSRRVIDLPAAVQAEVPIFVNDAIRSAQRKYNFLAMETTTTMITTLGTLVPTPNTILNFKEYKDKGPYLLRRLVPGKRYLTATAEDAAAFSVADVTLPDEPRFLTKITDPITGIVTFSVWPYPNNISDWQDGNWRIVVPAYVYSTKLVNDADLNWFTENMDDYIVREATGYAFGLDWDYNSMAVWLQQADVKFQEAKKADKMQRLGSVDTFVPMHRGANQPQVRR